MRTRKIYAPIRIKTQFRITKKLTKLWLVKLATFGYNKAIKKLCKVSSFTLYEIQINYLPLITI